MGALTRTDAVLERKCLLCGETLHMYRELDPACVIEIWDHEIPCGATLASERVYQRSKFRPECAEFYRQEGSTP